MQRLDPGEPVYVYWFTDWDRATYCRVHHFKGFNFHQVWLRINGQEELKYVADEELRTLEAHTRHLLAQ